ncbi:hypothetical protein T08_2802 [Trichinella sp. T8]|nr:hypothetical protein T08_2802 [Trichinella sp. T8]
MGGGGSGGGVYISSGVEGMAGRRKWWREYNSVWVEGNGGRECNSVWVEGMAARLTIYSG